MCCTTYVIFEIIHGGTDVGKHPKKKNYCRLLGSKRRPHQRGVVFGSQLAQNPSRLSSVSDIGDDWMPGGRHGGVAGVELRSGGGGAELLVTQEVD